MTTTETGTLAQKVLDYTRVVQDLVPTVRSAGDWSPLEAFVAVDDFERTGCFLEVQDWQQYTEMMAGWASGPRRSRRPCTASSRWTASCTSRSRNATTVPAEA